MPYHDVSVCVMLVFYFGQDLEQCLAQNNTQFYIIIIKII